MAQKKKSALWLAWGLLIITDLSFRGTSWLAHNVSGLRFLANYVMSALALLGLLYLLSFIKRKVLFWLLYGLLILIPSFLQANYFLVYKKFISPSEFGIFFDSTRMALATGSANIQWGASFFLSIMVLVAGILLYRTPLRRKWVMIPAWVGYIGLSVFLSLH